MNDNQFMTPTNFSDNINGISQKRSKKGIIIFTLGLIAVLAIIVVAVVLITKNNFGTDSSQAVSEESSEVHFISNSDYPTALNIYANVHDYISLDDLDKIIEESGYEIKKDVYGDDDQIVYLLPAIASKKGSGDCKYNVGYVQYRIDADDEVAEGQEPVKKAIDFEYHECVEGKDTYIMEIAGGKFRNYSGKVMVDYDSKEDAILNQLNVRAK